MNKKILLSSFLTLILCFSLIAGATFALFTSEKSTNIAINSGKVEVIATIENLTLYSPTLIAADGSLKDATNAATDTLFSNGGSAELENGVKLTLTNVTPGDKVNFQIKLTNNSNVAIQYRTVVRVLNDTGLASGLKMVIGENYDGSTLYTNWTPLTVAETTKVLDCSVELPTTAGNAYQNKSCTVVYTVEAIQANAETDNNVAKIGDTAFVDLQSAINAAQSGETVEIIRPGTYAPFTISEDKENVTVKGIIGTDKASSTVIRTTATDNVRAYGDGTVLDSLWIETPVAQSINWMHAGAISPYYNSNAGYIAKDLTVKNCHLDGNNAVGHAILYCSTGLTFTNNTVENFDVGVYVMNDNTSADGFEITGNTFVNVKDPFNGYWGGKAEAANAAVVFKNNTVSGDDTAYVTIWDYAQNSNAYSAFSSVEVSGNKGNIVYCLTHFDYKAATSHTVTPGEGTQEVRYLSKISSDIPYADRANYEIKKADGTAWDNTIGNNTFSQSIDGNAGVYTLTVGNYLLVNKTTGVETPFEITAPVVGQQQVIKLPEVDTAGDMQSLLTALQNVTNDGSASVIEITSDINLNGEWTAYALPYATDAVIINGNGHTITGLTQPLLTGTAAGSSSITINNLTISGAQISGKAYNSLGLGAFIAEADSVKFIKFNDCHVVDSSVTCTGVGLDVDSDYGENGYAGAFIGYFSSNDGGKVTFDNCSVVETAVTGWKSVGGLIGHAGGAVEIKDSSVENCTFTENLSGRTSAGAATLIGRLSGATATASGTITVKGNTVNQGAAASAANNPYCANATINTTGATLVTE